MNQIALELGWGEGLTAKGHKRTQSYGNVVLIMVVVT